MKKEICEVCGAYIVNGLHTTTHPEKEDLNDFERKENFNEKQKKKLKIKKKSRNGQPIRSGT